MRPAVCARYRFAIHNKDDVRTAVRTALGQVSLTEDERIALERRLYVRTVTLMRVHGGTKSVTECAAQAVDQSSSKMIDRVRIEVAEADRVPESHRWTAEALSAAVRVPRFDNYKPDDTIIKQVLLVRWMKSGFAADGRGQPLSALAAAITKWELLYHEQNGTLFDQNLMTEVLNNVGGTDFLRWADLHKKQNNLKVWRHRIYEPLLTTNRRDSVRLLQAIVVATEHALSEGIPRDRSPYINIRIENAVRAITRDLGLVPTALSDGEIDLADDDGAEDPY